MLWILRSFFSVFADKSKQPITISSLVDEIKLSRLGPCRLIVFLLRSFYISQNINSPVDREMKKYIELIKSLHEMRPLNVADSVTKKNSWIKRQNKLAHCILTPTI